MVDVSGLTEGEYVNVIVSGAVVIEAANLLTGSIAEPMFAYYDLEAVSVIELTKA